MLACLHRSNDVDQRGESHGSRAATVTFRRLRRSRGSAPTNARSAPIAWIRCFSMFARTAAAASCRDPSARRRNGDRGFPLPSARLRTSAGTQATAARTLPPTAGGSRTSRRRSDERSAGFPARPKKFERWNESHWIIRGPDDVHLCNYAGLNYPTPPTQYRLPHNSDGRPPDPALPHAIPMSLAPFRNNAAPCGSNRKAPKKSVTLYRGSVLWIAAA